MDGPVAGDALQAVDRGDEGPPAQERASGAGGWLEQQRQDILHGTARQLRELASSRQSDAVGMLAAHSLRPDASAEEDRDGLQSAEAAVAAGGVATSANGRSLRHREGTAPPPTDAPSPTRNISEITSSAVVGVRRFSSALQGLGNSFVQGITAGSGAAGEVQEGDDLVQAQKERVRQAR